MLEGVQKILMKGFLIHTDIKVRTLGYKVYAREQNKCRNRRNPNANCIRMLRWKCYLTLTL